MDIVDLRAGRESPVKEWEAVINKTICGRRVVFTDGSKMEGVKGEVVESWFEEGDTTMGGVPVRPKATVWDREIARIKGALKIVDRIAILILADTRVTLKAIKVSGARGKVRMRRLVEVVHLISEIENEYGEKSISLDWIKGHVGIGGNEEVDKEAKEAARLEGGRAVTEGDIRACMKEMRKEERVVGGFEVGRVV